MDAAAEIGRNPVSKHQIQPEYGDEQADAGRDSRTRLATKFSGANGDREGNVHFPCSADHEHDWQPYPVDLYSFFSFSFFFNLTYSRWTSSLPSCLWSQRIFPSLPGSRLTIFYRDASSALLQLVNQWLNFTYSRSHAFRYERKNTNPTLVRIELTTSALAGVQVNY